MSDESGSATVRGPSYRCKNGDCELMHPKTTVHESDRKKLFRCPGCRQVLHIDWSDDDE
jgi:predicted Zn-dependent protease